VSKPFAESRPGMPFWRSSPWLASAGTLWMARTWDADGASLYGSVSRPLGAGTCGWWEAHTLEAAASDCRAVGRRARQRNIIWSGGVWMGRMRVRMRTRMLSRSLVWCCCCVLDLFSPARLGSRRRPISARDSANTSCFQTCSRPGPCHPLVSSLPLGHTNSRCPCHWHTASLGVHAKPVPVIHSALHRSIPPTTGLTMAGHESLQRAVACLTCGSRCYLTFDPRHAYTGALS
jgi:hypothetical protein